MILQPYDPALFDTSVAIAVAFLALVEGLRRTFATRQDLHGIAQRIAALEALCMQAQLTADEARERARIAQALLEQMERRLEREEGRRRLAAHSLR